MTYFKAAAISGIIFITAGCSNAQHEAVKAQPAQQAVKAQHDHNETGYKKLTAPVQITHSFEGAADIGVMEDVSLNVKTLVPGSKVSLEVLSGPGVQVFETAGFDGIQRTVDSFEGDTMSLQFQPLAEGIHDITVRANVYLPDGMFMTSTYTVPVVVGKQYQAVKKSSTDRSENTGPKQVGGLAIMDAEETIKD